ncbi:Clp amino terminal domain-containing protein, pathogenicity island component [Nonomuraea solani]|uniref:Clp amino terminal domain-containing protein, pathogenicity island component n=1 Tax=Nonomuraea solani TaxID=1144553 RepID=A0A1H6DER6_9ACTN|nr:Clp amino terminal domain-containing protein, pathogenicity island component [Nonomuraea solani]
MLTRIVRAAHDQAAAAGDDWVGPPHVVLALLNDDSLAARVLAEAGLDHARALECLPRHARRGHRAGGFANPSFHKLFGIATGLALASGAREPAPEHWLLALAYDAEMDREPTPLHLFEVDPAVVVAALRRHGVQTPPIGVPEHVPWRGHHQIVVPAAALQAVLDRLNAEHPAGSEWRWGWNWVDDDLGRAMITAEEGIDLASCAGAPASDGRPSAHGSSPGSPGGDRAAGFPPTGDR